MVTPWAHEATIRGLRVSLMDELVINNQTTLSLWFTPKICTPSTSQRKPNQTKTEFRGKSWYHANVASSSTKTTLELMGVKEEGGNWGWRGTERREEEEEEDEEGRRRM